MSLPFAHADQREALSDLVDILRPFFKDLGQLRKDFASLCDALATTPPRLEDAGRLSMRLAIDLSRLGELWHPLKTVADTITVGCAWAVPGAYRKVAQAIRKQIMKGGET